MISANKIPMLGHSFPMKASHTTPKLRANCQDCLKILLHIWVNASHFDITILFLYTLSVLSSKHAFINAHFWYKTKICKYLFLFSFGSVEGDCWLCREGQDVFLGLELYLAWFAEGETLLLGANIWLRANSRKIAILVIQVTFSCRQVKE